MSPEEISTELKELPMWGGLSGCGHAFQRVQPVEGRRDWKVDKTA